MSQDSVDGEGLAGTGAQTPRATKAESAVGSPSSGDLPVAEQIAQRVSFDQRGLAPAVIQQFDSGQVLMLGYMDAEALRRTLTTGRVTFWSRSRQEYWRKGDTSGHVQYVKAVSVDCDGDTLLVQVDQVGAACHTGCRTCFEAGGSFEVVQGFRKATEEAV